MTAQTIAKALGGIRSGSNWVAHCPAHEDASPSLSIADVDDKVLVYCHAGCTQSAVISALHDLGLWSSRCRSAERANKFPKKSYDLAENHILKRSRSALSIWAAGVEPHNSPVEDYLASRGLHLPEVPNLRFHPRLKHPTGGFWPGMISLVTRGDEATPLAIHRTFLSENGERKAPIHPNKMMIGPCGGGAVRLSDSKCGHLVACEGIETGLSLLQGNFFKEADVWAALSTSGMKGLELPSEAGELTVAADGDPPGRKAGRQLAVRASECGWQVRIMTAPEGQDWNDVLLERLNS